MGNNNHSNHDWNIEYERSGAARASFLFEIMSEYVQFKCNRILDLGCGAGDMSVAASKRCSFVVGLDKSREEVKKASRRASLGNIVGIDFMVANALFLPFSENAFDIVIAYDLYEYFDDKNPLLKEILRVVNEGRILCITTGNRFFPLDRHTMLPFVDYLPKKLATVYVKLMRRRDAYTIFEPTYWSLRRELSKYFRIVSIDGDSAIRLAEAAHSSYFQKYGLLRHVAIALCKALVKIGIFKFVTFKFIAISQKPHAVQPLC